jgi:sarcosine oxidase, subunit gamma
MRSIVLDPCSIIRVQTWGSEAVIPSAVEQVLDIAWPHKTGSMADGRALVICVGPTDWLVIASDPDAAEWLRQLDAALGDSVFRATNVSRSLARIQISDPVVREVLAKGCSLDLCPLRFASERSTRTHLAGMPVIIRSTGAYTFELIVTLSYADFLMSWLEDAAVEFSAGPV